MTSTLKPFFEPKGVAIIGASSSPDKLSYGILKNLLGYGYPGKVYPVNPRADEILGQTCYADIGSVPHPVDLAVVVLPSMAIPAIMESCGEKGIRAVTVISGGFREVGEEGKKLEEELLRIAEKHSIRMIGPNCVGTMNLVTGLNTTFIKGVPARGGIGFISQSGAVCGGVVNHIEGKGIGFSHFLSLGNEADVDETDMIEYLGQDEHTNVIAAYVEGIRDGEKFLKVCRKISGKKPLVILKAGRSEEGARAVSSHTGSLAGSHAAYSAAFRQVGAIEVFSVNDLLNVSMALDWQKPPKGRNIAIITNSGGPAALASDSLAEHQINLAEISGASQSLLRGKLNPAAQVANPVDMLGGANEDEYAHALDVCLKDAGVDMALAILVPTSLVNTVNVAKAIVDASRKTEKPVIACMMGSGCVSEARLELHGKNVPMVDFAELTGVMFGALARRVNSRKPSAQPPESGRKGGRESVGRLLMERSHKIIWGEHDTRPLLHAYGISLVPGKYVTAENEVLQAARELGYPVVLKVASQDVLHKSDAGAIKIGINNDDDLKTAVSELLKNVSAYQPDADVEGFLVEKMAPSGQEVIIGMKRDASFGPLMMFGLGGVFVELFRDVSFRVAPLNRQEALEMVQETKAFKLLNGFRGGVIYDLDAVLDNLIKLSYLAADFREIQEIEVNPLLVLTEGAGALALDCRMIVDKVKEG